MKRTFKLWALLLTLSLVLSACGGGDKKQEPKKEEVKTEDKTEQKQEQEKDKTEEEQKEEEAAVDTSEFVKLKMYLFGDKAPDTDKVYAEINKLLKEDINAEIEVSFMSWSDYTQKYPLAFASGEDFDIAYAAEWAFYNSQASKGGFLELTKDMLAKYAPMTAETMYPEAWEQAKVDGKVFMLPMNYKELSGYVYLVRGDLMDKHNIPEIKGMDGYLAYLDAIAKNEPQMVPLDVGSDFDTDFMFNRLWKVVENEEKLAGMGPTQAKLYVSKEDLNGGVKTIPDHPKFPEIIKKLKECKENGYWSKSALVNKVTNKESFSSGKGASALLNLNDAKGTYSSISLAHPEWDVRVFDAQDGVPPMLISFLGNGMGIHSKSKNPERALMFLDLLRNDERYHDLMSFGIEGVHYTKIDEKTIEPTENSSNYPIDGNCNWGIRNDRFWKQIKGGIPNYEEIYGRWVETAEPQVLMGYVFNDEGVKNEMATITNLASTDLKALMLGFVDDVDAAVKDIQDKYKLAGIEKVIEENNKQIAEFLK